jgi:hypothetical protein
MGTARIRPSQPFLTDASSRFPVFVRTLLSPNRADESVTSVTLPCDDAYINANVRAPTRWNRYPRADSKSKKRLAPGATSGYWKICRSGASSNCRACCDDLRNLPLANRPISSYNLITGQVWFFAKTRGLRTQEDIIHRNHTDEFLFLRDDRKPRLLAVSRSGLGDNADNRLY